MMVVKIPKDIREYKEKVFLKLTARQLIALGIAFIICVPTYIFGRKYLSDDTISWIIILISIPIGMIGFIKKNGMPFEKYALAMIRQVFIYPQRTYFKSINFFRIKSSHTCRGLEKEKNKRYRAIEKAYALEEEERSVENE